MKLNPTVPDDIGARLDRWLAEKLPERSRSEIQRWIKDGLVLVDDAPTKASHKLEPEQQVTVLIPATQPDSGLAASPIPLDIIYEDTDLLVINKPAGMVVHPAPGHTDDTLVNAVLHHAPELEGVGGAHRPGIVHRLDKETSGLIVVAKNDRAHRDLQSQFKNRTVYKEYLALVYGAPSPPAGRISAPMGRHPVERKRQAVLTPDPLTGQHRGREAITEYHTEMVYTPDTKAGVTGTFTLLRVVLHTGRTHQIRVHFAWRNHPIVGDTVYGFKRRRVPLDRQFLHAHRLRFRLPGTATEREFVAPLPADLQHVLDEIS